MNSEQRKVVGVRTSANKDYWKSKAASNSSCIFLERDLCLRGATNCCNRSRSSQTDSSSSSSLSVGPVANVTDVLQPSRLIVLTLYPPPVWIFPHSPTGTPHVHNDARDPSSERWNCVGENWPVILPKIATSTSIEGSFTCRKSETWDPTALLPSEVRRAEDFFALKNPDDFSRVWTRDLGYLKAARYR